MRIFCERCGREFESPNGGGTVCDFCRDGGKGGKGTVAEAAVEAVSGLAGLKAARGFTLSGLFSDVFRSHDEEETSRFWSMGAAGNIPSLDMVNTHWPRPWMFVRACLLMTVFCAIVYMAWRGFDYNINLLPSLMMVGCLLMPLTLLIFFFEMNVRRNISLVMVLRTFLIGSALAFFFTLPLFHLTEKLGLNDWLGASVAGIVEEVAKLLTVLLFVRSVSRMPYILNGLLFGASVGAGFAAFESMGYALRILLVSQLKLSLLYHDKIMQVMTGGDESTVLMQLVPQMTQISSSEVFGNISLRGMLVCLTGHILWTGMSAAALWMVRGRQAFRLSMLLDSRFLRIFLIAVVSHMVWNCPWEPSLVTSFDKYILLGLVNWIVVFAIIARGLEQLREAQGRAGSEMELGMVEAIASQCAYVTSISRTTAAEPSGIADHLGIRRQVEESAVRERQREVSRHEGRAWQKYYQRER